MPDLSSVSATATSTRPAGGGDPADEDDLEALRAVYGTGAGGSDSAQSEAEAKVRCHSVPPQPLEALFCFVLFCELRFSYLLGSEYQV